MQKSEQINELAKALASAQSQIRPVTKDAKNPHLHNRYATLDAIIAEIKEPLSSNGLAYSQLLDDANGAPALTTMLMHESGQWVASTVVVGDMKGNRGVNEMQVFGASVTYMKRYALAALLGISSDEDDDGNASGASLRQTARKPAQQTQTGDGDFIAERLTVKDTKKGKVYLLLAGGDTRASWWEGREQFIKAAPWIELTHDQLSKVGQTYGIPATLVEYEVSGQYKNATAVHNPATRPEDDASWTEDADTLNRFWAWTVNEKGLDASDVMEALGVETIDQYIGTKADAKSAIDDWLVDELRR
jgi:hypothetical protein